VFEQAFKNIDDILWKEAGCTTELDYTEQTSWLLFLKYLDGLEQDLADDAALNRKKYTYILDKPYRWDTWAAPKAKDGKLDHNKALTGDDLRDFVNQKLFPYLHGFKLKASGPNTIEYKVGEIFGEIKNKIQSGYNLREIIDHVDELRFRSQTEKHELSHLYEAKIKNTRKIDFADTFMVPHSYFDGLKPNKKPKKGDVLYTVTGSFGIPVIVGESVEFCFQRHIGLIRPRSETSSAWLYFLLWSPQVFKQANDGATGTAQKTVSLAVLRRIAVPKVPLSQQGATAAKLGSLSAHTQRLASLYERKLAALEALKKSLLHQAFSGQL
jgi:hypothetical protein